jgi:adenosylcobinamide-phosphate synthase
MRRPGLALGLVLGTVLDALLGDPVRGHPVALFGTAAARAEDRVWADSRPRGVAFVLLTTGPIVAASTAVQRYLGRPATAPAQAATTARTVTAARAVLAEVAMAAVTATATWTVLGGASLAAEAAEIARLLEAGDLEAARRRLPALCGRDPEGLDGAGLARAVVESVAENTCDAVVAPLFWGAAFGLPGLLGHRAVNTLDAMVGHHSPRYERFGWAAARLDDLAAFVPARLTALLAISLGPAVGGSARRGLRVLHRDGGKHPSPNAGRSEAAFAGVLGVQLGGVNVYGGQAESRGLLGDGPPPGPRDIHRAVALSRLTGTAAAMLAAGVAAGRRHEPGGVHGGDGQ